MNKIVMRNMRQVQTICEVLQLQKQRLSAELIKTNLQIQTKFATIKKIFYYQVNVNNQRLVISGRDSASARYNLQLLSRKMTQLIIFEEIEITKLLGIERAFVETIKNIDRKIQLMSMFEYLAAAHKTRR